MEASITIIVNKNILDKFTMALSLTGDSLDAAIEQGMKQYIATSFESASREFRNDGPSTRTSSKQDDGDGKANRRIPLWAIRPHQKNHKIIKAFFRIQDAEGKVKLKTLKELCSDKSNFDFYVPTFSSNYAQMKFDEAHSHGKVFEDDGEIVDIFPGVAAILNQYKSYFN